MSATRFAASSARTLSTAKLGAALLPLVPFVMADAVHENGPEAVAPSVSPGFCAHLLATMVTVFELLVVWGALEPVSMPMVASLVVAHALRAAAKFVALLVVVSVDET